MDPSEDDIVDGLRDLSTDAPNPAVRAISKLTAAIVEEIQNLATNQDEHETAVNSVRLNSAIEELANIHPDVWQTWVEADQENFVNALRKQVKSLTSKHLS